MRRSVSRPGTPVRAKTGNKLLMSVVIITVTTGDRIKATHTRRTMRPSSQPLQVPAPCVAGGNKTGHE
ncbi:protein of unknown function [Hyphomicrobium sp. MC1]|nr:protein of unknown function [Hyphomicrobium sp. MC1]